MNNYLHISPKVLINDCEHIIDFYLSVPGTISLLDKYKSELSKNELESVDVLRRVDFKNGKVKAKISDLNELELIAYSFLNRLDEMNGESLYDLVFDEDDDEILVPIYN